MQKNNKVNSLITPNTFITINNVLSSCCNLKRWSSVPSPVLYNELSKQSLNCAVAFVIAQRLKHDGKAIDLTKFPKIAISRLFERNEICDLQEDVLDMLETYGPGKDAIMAEICKRIAQTTSEEFSSFLFVEKDCIESKIYRLSTKVATLIELYEIRVLLSESVFVEKRDQILDVLHKYNEFDLNINGLTMGPSIEYTIFSLYSSLRNRIRWAKWASIVECSVLGHQMDTAILAYLNVLESSPKNEKVATKLFWIGIFHDFPETWTGDMPSPLKDAIPGLRKATEDLELEMMQKHIYSKAPLYLTKALKGVMLEDEANSFYKPTLKVADTMSANVECWRQLYAGSHVDYFKSVLERSYKTKEDLSVCERQLLEYLCTVLND